MPAFKENLQVLVLGLLVLTILFVYDLPFSLNEFKTVPNLSNFALELEKNLAGTQFYKYKSSERDFWSKVKGSDVVRLDPSLANFRPDSGAEEQSQATEPEEKVLYQFGGEALTPDEVEMLEKYRIEREEERKRKEREAKIHLPSTVLIVGDSTIVENVGDALQSSVEQVEGLTAVKFGKYSTGLNKRDYYDWQTKTQELIAEHKPQTVIAMFGANDGQPILSYETGILHQQGTAAWEETYRSRVREYFRETTKEIKKLYIIGQPNTTSADFSYKFNVINRIFKEEAEQNEKVVYIDTWEKFTVNGRAAISLPNAAGRNGIVKFEDGIHLTDHGSKIVSELVMERVNQDILRE